MYCQLCSESRGGLLVLELGISTTCVKEKKVNNICPWSFMWDINCERYIKILQPILSRYAGLCTLYTPCSPNLGNRCSGRVLLLAHVEMLEAMWLDHILMHFAWDIRPSCTCILLNGYIWYRSSCIAFLQQNSNMRWHKDSPTTHAQPFPPYLEMLNGIRRSVGYDDQAIQASMQSCQEGQRRHGYAGCGVPVE